mgnify:CR=1 FL=1
MENVVGTFASHRPQESIEKYLSDDPAFPCAAMDKKYQASCFQFVVFRIGELFGDDFEEVAKACEEKVPSPYDRACFSSLGSNAARANRENPAEVWRICNYVAPGEGRVMCFAGARRELEAEENI